MRILLFIIFYSIQLLATETTTQTKIIQLKQDFKPVVHNEALELLIPIPMDLNGYQSVQSQEHSGNADSIKIESIGDVKYLHAKWAKAVDPELHVITQIKLNDFKVATKEVIQLSNYLKPTEHVQTDGIVRETALKIIGKIKNEDQRALAIYNWIVEKTLRDPNTKGCGLGDVKTTLTSGNLSGKCADINSLFVGLARSVKIPAREVFGLRVDVSKEFTSLGRTGEVSKSQHCRAEYYSKKQKSWIPVDPADVRKAILEEKLTLNDPQIEKLKRKFFGYWEGSWAAFNFGRDFKIQTQNKVVEINYFMYPLLVSKNLSPDGVTPSEVKYTLTSQVITQ